MTVTGVNDSPVANNDTFTTSEDALLNVAAPGVLLNDSDVDGDRMTVTSVTGASSRGASLTLNADGSFSYDPRNVAALQASGANDR